MFDKEGQTAADSSDAPAGICKEGIAVTSSTKASTKACWTEPHAGLLRSRSYLDLKPGRENTLKVLLLSLFISLSRLRLHRHGKRVSDSTI